jgi:hypothetical protein
VESSLLEFPPLETSVEPALAFIGKFAEQLGIEPERRSHLAAAAAAAIRMVLRGSTGERVGVEVEEASGTLLVQVINRGEPIFWQESGQLFHEVSRHLESVSVENRGRSGQVVRLAMHLGAEAAKRAVGEVIAGKESWDAEVTIRPLQAGEEAALSQLFYHVYGYQYIQEFIYYPEKIREKREAGTLHSIVAALPSGRLVGHVGLLKWGDVTPVYEPCLGVVDPRLKSRGLFGKIFQATMEKVAEIPMHYILFDFVTNHDLSQRLVWKYNPCELALFIGCQTKATQCKLEKLGLGEDSPEMDRYSLLYAIQPRVPQPFGPYVQLPGNLGEMLGFLLEPLGLQWYPAPRFDVLPSDGEYQTHFQPSQSAAVFDLIRSGRRAVDRLLGDWSALLRNGYQYAAVEVALSEPGLGNLYDALSEAGFFVAGFVPYHYSDKLALRFQALGPTKVAFDDIKVFSSRSQKLLAVIRENYERNNP